MILICIFQLSIIINFFNKIISFIYVLIKIYIFYINFNLNKLVWFFINIIIFNIFNIFK